MKNNFITNYKELTNRLKDMINKYKLSNMIIQNKLYILINKLGGVYKVPTLPLLLLIYLFLSKQLYNKK